MSAATIVVITVATVGLAALELLLFWRLGERAARKRPSRRLAPPRFLRRAPQKPVRQRLHRRGSR